jgi:hypothetical protein
VNKLTGDCTNAVVPESADVHLGRPAAVAAVSAIE